MNQNQIFKFLYIKGNIKEKFGINKLYNNNLIEYLQLFITKYIENNNDKIDIIKQKIYNISNLKIKYLLFKSLSISLRFL